MISLIVHVVVLLGLALAGWEPPAVVPQRITVLDTSAEPEPEIIEIRKEIEVSDEVTEDIGLPKSEVVFSKWKRWLEKESKALL